MRITVRSISTFLAAVAILLCLFGCDGKKTDKGDYDSTEAIEKIAELEIQRNELADKKKSLTAGTRSRPITILCFDSIDDSIYDVLYPMMRDHGYPGVIVLKGNALPGDEGMLSISQLSELLSAGWELALGDNGERGTSNLQKISSDELAAYIDKRLGQIETLGFARPTTFCFTDGYYDPKYDAVIAEKGFKVLRHFGEEDGNIFVTALSKPVWKVGSDYVHAGDTIAQANIETSIRNCAIMALTTRKVEKIAEITSIDCNEAKYLIVLDTLRNYAQLSEYSVETFSGAYEYRKKFEENNVHNEKELEAAVAEIDAKIAEIDAEISNLMKQGIENS